MKYRIIVLATLAATTLTMPVLSFAHSPILAEDVHQAHAEKFKLVPLGANPSISDVAAALKSLAGYETPELLGTLGRRGDSLGKFRGNIWLIPQETSVGPKGQKVEMISVDRELSALEVFGIDPSPDPAIFKPGIVWSRYARVNGQGVLAKLEQYARETMPRKGLNGLFERSAAIHASPLPSGFIPEPEQAFDEQFVGPSGRFITILRPGKSVTFSMGSKKGEHGRSSDETQHEVTLTQGFKMQMTRATWRQVIAFKRELRKRFDDLKLGPSGLDHPAVNMTLSETQEFISGASTILKACYRLPTEAQWEFAARGGIPGFRFFFGNDKQRLPLYGWYLKNADLKTHPVAGLRLNPYGLDIIGNVWVWMLDRYGDYPKEALTDPAGPPKGSEQVLRGGSIRSRARALRPAHRKHAGPTHFDDHIGMSLIMPLNP